MFYYISSSYLCVFGDDRIYGTRKQMMLQVDPVRLRDRAWDSLGVFHIVVFIYLWILEICNL